MNEIVWTPGISLEAIEKVIIKRAYAHFQNNKAMTAKSLGICVRTLDYKFLKYADEEKEEEKLNEQRRAEAHKWNQRARGLDPDFRPRAGISPQSSIGSAEGTAVPVQKSEDIPGVLPSQITTFHSKKARR